MITKENLHRRFPLLEPVLIDEMLEFGQFMAFDAHAQLVKEGQYITLIPLVLSGVVKVFTSKDDKELLLYYIKPDESCIMSFAASLKNEPTNIFAVTQEPCEVLLLPTSKVMQWVKMYPSFNLLFFSQYHTRYADLLQTIQQVVFEKLDSRLLFYLQEQAKVIGSNRIKMSHKQIANDLGTAREVVTRLMKKLEQENLVKQDGLFIEILLR